MAFTVVPLTYSFIHWRRDWTPSSPPRSRSHPQVAFTVFPLTYSFLSCLPWVAGLVAARVGACSAKAQTGIRHGHVKTPFQKWPALSVVCIVSTNANAQQHRSTTTPNHKPRHHAPTSHPDNTPRQKISTTPLVTCVFKRYPQQLQPEQPLSNTNPNHNSQQQTHRPTNPQITKLNHATLHLCIQTVPSTNAPSTTKPDNTTQPQNPRWPLDGVRRGCCCCC